MTLREKTHCPLWRMAPPRRVELYTDGGLRNLRVPEIAEYLDEKLKDKRTSIAGSAFHAYLTELDESGREAELSALAVEIASARIHSPLRENSIGKPLAGEVAYERKRIDDPDNANFGVLYDGPELQRILGRLFIKRDEEPECYRIIFTNRLIGTWDPDNRRRHARVSLYGFPSLISTTGAVVAPAKPREFYIGKRIGLAGNDPAERSSDCFLEQGDERLTEVLKGYALQALFYYMTGNPFCENRSCRLFNAHWQTDLICAQLQGDLCCEHREILQDLLAMDATRSRGSG